MIAEWEAQGSNSSEYSTYFLFLPHQEAIERKEKRAQRFHFHGEEKIGQRNVFLDKDAMKKGTCPP